MHRATADALAQALTWRLRELRIRVGIAELEQANAILQTQDDWNDAELEQVLLPIFAKRHDDRLLVSRLIGEMLTRPTSPPASPPELEPETNDDTTSERPPPPPPDPLWQQFVRRVRSLLRSKWTIPILWFLAALSFVPAIIGPLSDVVRQVSLRIDAILAGLGGALRNPLGGDLLSKGQDFQSLQLAVVVRHAVVSSLTASGAVLVLLAIRLTFKKTPMVTVRRRKVDEKRAVVGDESVFRVGSLGGSAAPFLDPVLAQEIVELITYRQTERLRRDLDVPATIERRARGDRDTLVFERRRELPTVVILVDLATDARHWNTLPEEFKTSLEKQGLRVETLPYYGTLSRPSPYATHSSDTVEGTLNALADRTGWMLTAIFGDLKRLSVADVAILSAQREQGPVLAFDYTDPRIWDARHAAFETLGLGPYPATGFAVRQALATAFAPDRSATRSAKSVRADKPAFFHLSAPHLEWAIACAMVEPISFSLAEQLRKAHPMLSGRSEALAFTLLSALPESWVSREGLRFAPQIRRDLLSRASRLSVELQTAFLTVFDTAFGEEPPSVTAGELWRYARGQAELFTTVRQSRALQDLADVKLTGIIDPEAFDDFVSRLRQPGRKLDAGTIQLPAVVRNSPRLSLLSEGLSPFNASGPQFASWSIGLSDVRVRGSATASPLAAFFAGGQSFMTIDKSGAEPFSRIDAIRGTKQVMTQLASLSSFELQASDFTQVDCFPDDQGGVLVTRQGRLFTMLKANEGGEDPLPNLILQEMNIGVELGDEPLVSTNADGSQVACATAGLREVTLVTTAGNNRPTELRSEAPITAIAFSQRGAGLLVATIDGNVLELFDETRIADLSSVGGPYLASFDGQIAALCDLYDDQDQRYIVAALADGRVGVQGSSSSAGSYYQLAWRPKYLTVFSDRKAGLAGSQALGISVAVTGADGQFDIIGMDLNRSIAFENLSLLDGSIDPSRDGLAVLAINRDRRRIIVRNGFYLEVRPLLYNFPEPTDVDVGLIPRPQADVPSGTTEIGAYAK